MIRGYGIRTKARFAFGNTVSGLGLKTYRLAPGAFAAQSALPVASPAATSGTAAEMRSVGGGKVTPVRYEHGQQDGSGQEENGEHVCSHFR